MQKWVFSIFLFLVVLNPLTAGIVRGAETLDRSKIELIKASVYEVVVPKIEDSNVTYEKELPWELVPFQLRNDPYHSIGTAFSIGENTFISAAHVLALHEQTQFAGVSLRDTEGNIYPVDQILKYSGHKDYVQFSVSKIKNNRYLSIEENPEVNETVFAVGNALGEGVIIRNGLYTSQTPEELEGEWKWIRFSAAASPGNSGGPLLNEDGQVIGIVLRKSENENLNYALPIKEVTHENGKAGRFKGQMIFRFENMDMSHPDLNNFSIPLPKPIEQFRNELSDLFHVEGAKMGAQFIEKYKSSIFPNGSGSTDLLENSYTVGFPHLISKSQDGNWDLFRPEKRNSSDLGNNGYLTYGSMNSTFYLKLRKPDNIDYKMFLTDSKLFMDTMLKGFSVTRRIGNESIRVTSLGAALDESVYSDNYGRKWATRTWNLPYSDSTIRAYILPVPLGSIMIFKYSRTGGRFGNDYDLKYLTDFLYYSYYGTFEQWKDYLSMKDFLPTVFNNLKFQFEYGDKFTFSSNRLTFNYDNSLMKINEKSDLTVGFSYIKENNKTIWDATKVVAGEDQNTNTLVSIRRNIKPREDANDENIQEWEKMRSRDFPYNTTSYFNEKKTYIGTSLNDNIDQNTPQSASLSYSVFYIEDGSIDDTVMRNKLSSFEKNILILEKAK